VQDCIKALYTSPKCYQTFIDDACNYEDIDIIIPPLDYCLFLDILSKNEWEQANSISH
ncbi:38469_t:CDS:2, partial [Gigaspora margarita]